MSEMPFTPGERRAAEEVRWLPEPRARAEFRARLRAEFVAGAIPSTAPARRGIVIPFPVRAALALAAAVAGVFLVLRRSPEPQWDAVAVPVSGEVTVAGRSYSAEDVTAWRGELHPGVLVAWAGEEPLQLMLPKRLALQLMPGATLTLPEAPGGRGHRVARLEVRAGAMQVSTGPEFAGGRLTVHTVPVDVEVVGTTFSVIRMPDFCCVCVLEGTVQLHMGERPAMSVPSGERRVVHDDGRIEAFDEVEPSEVPVLERFRAAAAASLGDHAPGRS